LLHAKNIGLSVFRNKFHRKALFASKELYVCIIQGSETFRMVHPAYMPNLYPGGLKDELSKHETPFDLFDGTVSSH